MTAAPGYERHSDESLLEELSTLVGIRQGIGEQEDSEHTSVDRCVWIPGPWKAGPLRIQPSDGEAVAEHQRRYDVALYASSFSGLQILYHALVRALDARLTRTGFEIAEATPKPRAGTAGAGWGITVPVTIKGPVYRELYGTVTPTSHSVGISVTGPSGANPEALP